MSNQFDEAGFELAVVAIGSPEGARTLCKKLSFPEEKFYVDDGDRKLYGELRLNWGPSFFWSDATKRGVKAIEKDMPNILSKYSIIVPPSIESTLQLGGVFVIDKARLIYAHIDEGLGDHAPNDQVLRACCAKTQL